MTVKQLKKKLEKMHDDVELVFEIHIPKSVHKFIPHIWPRLYDLKITKDGKTAWCAFRLKLEM